MNNALAVIAVVLVQTAAGLGVLGLCGIGSTTRYVLRYAAVAPLAGIAWTGIVGALLSTLGWRLGVGGLTFLAVATCAAGAARVARRPASEVAQEHAPYVEGWLERALVVAGALALLVVVTFATTLALVKPLAEYDGWAMWGMKSRAIATLGGADPALFASPAYSRLHLEYPLLLPSLHALPLQLRDGLASNVVVLSCLAIGLAGLVAIWGLLRDRVRASLLVPFLAALAAAPAFFGQLVTGYADVPLAAFVAAGVVAASRWLLDDRRAWLALATLFLAAAALTKNEGLLFGAATYAALLATAVGRRRTVAISALLVALAYAPWRAFTTIHDLAPSDYDLTSSFDLRWVAGRLHRGPEAAEGLLRRATADDQLGLLVLLAALAIAVAIVVGPRRLALFGAGFGLLSFAGLTWIYVLSPNGVHEFLVSNGDRIVMSLVVGVAALTPLLFEEAARQLARGRGHDNARR